MPNVFGIPLIGFIQMVLGTVIIVFLLIKFLTRPKMQITLTQHHLHGVLAPP